MCLQDRISDLPIDVRKHILSFLPTRDAICTSLLSKSWRYDWLSLPFLDLGQGFFLKRWKFVNDFSYEQACQNLPDPDETLAFLEFLDKAIISKQQKIQRLKLCLPPIHDLSSRIAICLDGLIVNELEAEVIGDSEISNRSRFYYLPMCVLSSTCMTKLYIQGCNLTGISVNEINLPSLRELSVSYVIMDQQVVESLIASCTGVENLSFTYCQGFRSLQISGLPRLTYLEQKFNRHLEVFEINEESLRSLCHAPDTRCKLVLPDSCPSLTQLELCECRLYDGFDIRTCQNLVVLKLLRCGIINEFLDQHLSQLSCLKALEIACCYGASDLKITSNHLQSLIIRCGRDRQLKHAEINCPNLVHFTFCTGGGIISLSSETILAPACVSLQFSVNGTGDSSWDVNLVEFLKQLRLSKYLTIETVIIENVIIPARLRLQYPSPLCQFEQVKLFPERCVSCLDVTRSIDALLWLCPELKTLSILDEKLGPNPPPLSRQHTRSLLKMLLRLNYKNQTELSQTICGCNPSLTVNCWRHSLRDFEIIEQHGFEDNDGSLRRFLERQ